MLRDRDAKIDNGAENPILAAVQRGNRECFAALIEGREKDVLKLYNGKSLIYHAIKNDSTLLPLIASLANNEYQRLKNKNEQGNITFPPSDLNAKQKKKLTEALQYNDVYLPYDVIKRNSLQHRSPWRHVKDPIISQEDQDELNSEMNQSLNTDDASQRSNSASVNVPNKHKSQSQQSQTEDDDNDDLISEMMTFSTLDDEDEVMRTQSGAFDEAPRWIPVSQRIHLTSPKYDSDNISTTITAIPEELNHSNHLNKSSKSNKSNHTNTNKSASKNKPSSTAKNSQPNNTIGSSIGNYEEDWYEEEDVEEGYDEGYEDEYGNGYDYYEYENDTEQESRSSRKAALT